LIIPGRRYFSGPDVISRAFAHLARYHGLSDYVASERLHRLKSMNGLAATDGVIIGHTGDVYDVMGDHLGMLTDSSLGGVATNHRDP
jgi:hypothetical protein